MSYLSIDIGGTYIKFGLIDRAGRFERVWKEKTPNELEQMEKIFYREIRKYESKLKGIAFSCPGRVDSMKGYVHTGGSIDFLYDYHLKNWIESITNLPFAVINDGKAAALAEWWLGNLKGIKNGAAVVLGTGVGGGLILDDKLYQGPHFQAGELSFVIGKYQGTQSFQTYGQIGSAVGFIRHATKLLGVSSEDYEAVFVSLERKDHPMLNQFFIDYCHNIAVLLVNMQVLLDLEKVVIGGGISEQSIVIQTICDQYGAIREESPILGTTFKPLEIESCAFYNSSNLLGALHQLLLEVDAANQKEGK